MLEGLRSLHVTNEKGLSAISDTHYSQRGFPVRGHGCLDLLKLICSHTLSLSNPLPPEQGDHRTWPEKVPWQ